MNYAYKVVPAPTKGIKAKGVKGAEAQFAHALSELMNSLAAEGWEYQRADTLPSETRSGLTGKTTVYRNMLVFRRAIEGVAAEAAPLVLDNTTASNAPALPSAQTAQELPETIKPIEADTNADKREVAAE